MSGRAERLRFMLPIAGMLGLCALAFWIGGLRLNLSASQPVGLYRVAPDGRLAAACLDGAAAELARAREYLRRGTCPLQLEPVLKRIVALGGDHVSVSDAGVLVNGTQLPNSVPAERDSAGRPMPSLIAKGAYQTRLAADELWLASFFSSASYDSRYYGPVRAGQIRERLEPVWIVSGNLPW